ncbi:hypothetical protein P879_09565 [Paragonimus westermani]|uniref:Protein kinase domain-containing protein n=1 Tax=Paragonimus westermani TaxID=34504 RepID=A0A8T0CZS1_9TREM|nr:hypothetical protein P879_09565 [Paragonimus westermani]
MYDSFSSQYYRQYCVAVRQLSFVLILLYPFSSNPIQLFDFWTEFLADVDRSDCSATKTDASSVARELVEYRTHFPVLVMGSHIDRWEPAFLYLNIEKDPKDIRISFYDRDRQHLRQSRSCDIPEEEESIRMLEDCVRQDDDHVFYLEDIKGISMTKQRSVYLFTVFYSLDFTFKFSCENVREQFCSVVRDQFLSEEQLGGLIVEDSPTAPLEFEYENDERELGRGSFGVVYVGRLVTSQRKIAIKEIPADDSSQFQEVVEEIRLHSRLAHPNIVCYLGAVLQDGQLKILMELVPGGSLTSLLKKYGPLKEPAVAEYSEQILQGLNYLHSHRILHRDIKADNILIDQFTGVVKISDFGVSKRLVGLHAQAQSFKGTIQYMAPELIDNRQGYGFSIDIWSFGCTVVQMLTGTIPFKEYDNPGAILYKCGNYGTGPAIPDHVSDLCRAFVLRTFEPKAANRPTAAVLLSDPFVRPYRKQRSKTTRAPATYGHTPSHRSHLHQLHPEPFDRFVSETESRSSSFKNGLFESTHLCQLSLVFLFGPF